MKWRFLLALVAVAGVVAAEAGDLLLVLGFDDAALPCDEAKVEVVVHRGAAEALRVPVADGWPVGASAEELTARFGGAGEPFPGSPRVVRAVVPATVLAGAPYLEAYVTTQRQVPLGAPIGLAPLDRLKTTPRRLPALDEEWRKAQGGKRVVELFLGPLVQEMPVNVVEIAPPIFPAGGKVALPFFTLHVARRDEVHPLLPYQGGPATYSSVFPRADGGWRMLLVGPGAFYIGAYGFGYGEVKSSGIVIRPDDLARTQTIQVGAITMEPLCWAVLAFDIDSSVPVERCLDVDLRLAPELRARDPMQPRGDLETLRLRPIYMLRPTHKRWIVGPPGEGLPPLEEAPFGLTAASWRVAHELVTGFAEAARGRAQASAPLAPGACIENGMPVAETHSHEASLKRTLLSEPEGLAATVFVGTAKTLRELLPLVRSQVGAVGAVVPAERAADWTLDHALLRRQDALVNDQPGDVEVKLEPFCVTTYRVLVDLDAAEERRRVRIETVVSEPHAIPPGEGELTAPVATLSRVLSLPPRTAPSTETVTLKFDQPIDARTVVVDVGVAKAPAVVSRLGYATVRLVDPQTVTATYDLHRMPEGAARVVTLRAGAQALDRSLAPLQQPARWRVDGDEPVPMK